MTKRRMRPIQLARRMGVSPGTVTRWKAGSMPDPDTLPRLARELGTSAAELQGLTTLREPAPLRADPAVTAGLRRLTELLDAAAAETRRIAALLPDDE